MKAQGHHSKLPKGAKASFVFLILALICSFPVFHAFQNPIDGFGGWGQGLGVMFALLIGVIPCAALSFIFGIFSIRKTAFAYVSVIPTSLFFLYILIHLTLITPGTE